jgi:hypothetical protein
MPLTQFSGWLPEHATWSGEQLPWQEAVTEVASETHVAVPQAEGEPHTPAALHVATALFVHSLCPATHTPTHAPFTHVWFAHLSIGVHADSVPSALQESRAWHWSGASAPPSGAVLQASGCPG